MRAPGKIKREKQGNGKIDLKGSIEKGFTMGKN